MRGVIGVVIVVIALVFCVELAASQSCDIYSSCTSCLSNNNCWWCGDGSGCVDFPSCSSPVGFASQCPSASSSSSSSSSSKASSSSSSSSSSSGSGSGSGSNTNTNTNTVTMTIGGGFQSNSNGGNYGHPDLEVGTNPYFLMIVIIPGVYLILFIMMIPCYKKRRAMMKPYMDDHAQRTGIYDFTAFNTETAADIMYVITSNFHENDILWADVAMNTPRKAEVVVFSILMFIGGGGLGAAFWFLGNSMATAPWSGDKVPMLVMMSPIWAVLGLPALIFILYSWWSLSGKKIVTDVYVITHTGCSITSLSKSCCGRSSKFWHFQHLHKSNVTTHHHTGPYGDCYFSRKVTNGGKNSQAIGFRCIINYEYVQNLILQRVGLKDVELTNMIPSLAPPTQINVAVVATSPPSSPSMPLVQDPNFTNFQTY